MSTRKLQNILILPKTLSMAFVYVFFIIKNLDLPRFSWPYIRFIMVISCSTTFYTLLFSKFIVQTPFIFFDTSFKAVFVIGLNFLAFFPIFMSGSICLCSFYNEFICDLWIWCLHSNLQRLFSVVLSYNIW